MPKREKFTGMADALEPCPDCGSMKHKSCDSNPREQEKMAKQILSLKPQQTRSSKDLWWYYENRGSIDVVVNATKIGVMSIRIPASMLRRTIKRQELSRNGGKGR